MKQVKGPGFTGMEFQKLRVGDLVTNGEIVEIVTKLFKDESGHTINLTTRKFFMEENLPEELR